MATNSDNRRDEGLQALGAKTKYRDDYAPEVLETFVNKHQATTTGCVSTVRSSHRCVRLPVSPTLRRYAYRMCRM